MTADQLVNATCFLFGVDRTELLSSNRTARVAEARQALAWALRQADWSLESIGALLHRDHTTIIYAVKAIERKAARSARFAERLAGLNQPMEPPMDWAARVHALEARVTELEASIREGYAHG